MGGGLSEHEANSLPGNPIVRAFLPQTRVLKQCSAAILHGGFNTVLDALAAGLPIVVVPLAFEQPATAARLARVGAASIVSSAKASRGGLVSALRRVLTDPTYRRSARLFVKDIEAGGGAAEAAELVHAALLERTDLMLVSPSRPNEETPCAA